MNSNKEDPNNHAPAVTPEDDWDGIDQEQVFDAQLPPRRSDAGKLSKADVNLSGFKSIEPARHSGSGATGSEEAGPKVAVSINVKVNSERETLEKEEFQPGLAMDDMKLDDAARRVIRKPIVPRQFKEGERDDWGTVHKKGSSAWMFYVAASVVLLVALTLFVSQFGGKKPGHADKNVRKEGVANADTSKVSLEDLGIMGRLANDKTKAMGIYAAYAQAGSVDEAIDMIYLGESHRAGMAKTWKALGAAAGWSPEDKTAWKPLKIDAVDCAELSGVNHDFSKFTAVFRYQDSSLKMDWKATVGYGTAGFEELKTGQGDGSEIRGWIERSNFYTKELPEDRYRSFVVRSPKKDQSIWVYTEIGTDTDDQLARLFEISPITGQHQTEAKVILNLERGDKEILPRQWMVKGLIASNWLDQATP